MKLPFMVDIDGTLTNESEGYGDEVYMLRTPKTDMIDKVNALFEAGHRIVLWTARYFSDKKITEDWLKLHGVYYHELHLGKPQYCVWVDDKAVHPDNFDISRYL